MGDEAGVASGPSRGALNAWPRPQCGVCYSQVRWAGLELDTEDEFPKISPRMRPRFLANTPSVLRRSPEPREGERLPSPPQYCHGRASWAVMPPASGKPGHLKNPCWELEAQSSRAGSCRDPSVGESSSERSRVGMPAAKSLGKQRRPRAGMVRRLPSLSCLGGPSAWHPGAPRPCPSCSGGCPSLDLWTHPPTLDSCYSRETDLAGASRPPPTQ